MSAHTPGPWEVSERGDFQPEIVAESGSFDGIAEVVWRDPIEKAETLANAHLMASAPDLLEACESIMDLGDDFKDEWFGTWLTVRDALNKAKGGTP